MKRMAFGLALMLLAVAPAQAAPQILGLVATGEPTPLQCDGERCTALLSAFCLQERRLPPDLDTAYAPADGAKLTLLATDADGRVHRIAVQGLVEFRTRYGYTSVLASLPRDAMAEFGDASFALSVAPRAVLLPVSVPGDPDPLSDEEIVLATGPLRLAAAAVFEGDGEKPVAARMTARLINALPATGDIAAGDREDLWIRVAGPSTPPLARKTFEACGRTVDQAVGWPLRGCLERRHRSLQIENTKTYWESLGGY